MQNKPKTISEYARDHSCRLVSKITFCGILFFTSITFLGTSLYHYEKIKEGMRIVSEGLSSTIGFGGDFIPKHIVKGAISTGNFKGFWIYDREGSLITQSGINYPQSPYLAIRSFQLVAFKKNLLILNNEKVGEVIGVYHIPLVPIFFLVFFISITIGLVVYLLNRSIHILGSSLTKPLLEMTDILSNEELIKSSRKWSLVELNNLQQTLQVYLKRSEEAERAARSAIVNQEVASIAYRVKHDIKSSLYTLENKLDQIPSGLSQSFKAVFDRIKVIANDIPQLENPLLVEDNTPHELRNSHIASVIQEIVNEFSTSALDGKNINFNIEYNGNSFHSFCNIDITKFKRVITNLFKNSIEAISSEGKINIILSNDEDFLYIAIQDNGVGIKKNQLIKIGELGVTSKGKEGSGLGLYSAIENIKKWRGSLEINSKYKEGTAINISIPLCEENFLMPTQVFIEPNTEVLVIDDDSSYLNLYREKFSSGNFDENKISFSFFDKIEFVRRKIKELKVKNKKYFLFSDQNFGPREITGLDLIKELKIEEKSILLTSDATKPSIIDKCSRHCIPVVSKSVVRDFKIFPAV